MGYLPSLIRRRLGSSLAKALLVLVVAGVAFPCQAGDGYPPSGRLGGSAVGGAQEPDPPITAREWTGTEQQGHVEPIGWDAVGPERGHVLDAAVGHNEILVTTRVGVMSADLGDGGIGVWRRDARFPTDTRRIVAGADGVWWCAAWNALWHVTGDQTTLVPLASGSAAVDIAVTESGVAIAAVRGETSAVIRVGSDGSAPLIVLGGVDPWCLVTRGSQVWVGTLGQGLWVSDDDGLSFTEDMSGASITALGFVGEHLWLGVRDGRFMDYTAGVWLGSVESGWVMAMAQSENGALVHSSTQDFRDFLSFWDGMSLSTVPLRSLGGDFVEPNLTGLWSLPDGSVLVGTFRRGPFVYAAGQLRPARSEFRATVIRGAARRGEDLMVAAMGTGVYLSDATLEQWVAMSSGGSDTPVTDTVALSKAGEALIAVDFEGVVRLDPSGDWYRVPGASDPSAPSTNSLTDVRADGQGRWWGITMSGHLLRFQDDRWLVCSSPYVRRLDGCDEHLVALTDEGFHKLESCDRLETRVWPHVPIPENPEDARADAGWLAVPGALYDQGELFAQLPPGPIEAMAGRPDEVLLAIGGTVHTCRDGTCRSLGSRFNAPIADVGWLADGRVWVAEATGTVWRSGGDQDPGPWSTLFPEPGRPMPSWSWYRVPWSTEGLRTEAPPRQQAASVAEQNRVGSRLARPTSVLWLLALGGGLTLVMGIAVVRLRARRTGGR